VKQRLRSRFRLLVATQVAALIATISLLAYVVIATDHIAVPVVLGIVVVMQVAGLLHSVESHIDTLEDFFATINHEDFTRRFVADDVDAELKEAFNAVIGRFRRARAERDVQAGYLETVVRHVPIPLMAVRSDGSLRLANNPLRRLTGVAAIHNLNDLGSLDPELPAALRGIAAGQQRLLQSRLRGLPVELRVCVSEIRLGGDSERIYSIENISGELKAREASAWRSLIRVLTHEIMNTLTPVASLAQSGVAMLDEPDAAVDLREALTTIARRSDGLMHFVERYRELLQVPKPEMQSVAVFEALRGATTLLADELAGVHVVIDVRPDSLDIQADPALLDQVLLNVLRNAAHALGKVASPSLTLSAAFEAGHIRIAIRDNGPGIPDHLIDQIFIPFFTTRRDGSGIGLSISRQIMTAHGGDLLATSGPDGTTMTLLF